MDKRIKNQLVKLSAKVDSREVLRVALKTNLSGRTIERYLTKGYLIRDEKRALKVLEALKEVIIEKERRANLILNK